MVKNMEENVQSKTLSQSQKLGLRGCSLSLAADLNKVITHIQVKI